jgi:hypothetical protein
MSICTSASDIPPHLKAIYTRGRQRDTTVWALTQRPKTIPLICMSEATHFIIFDLNIEADRKRIMEVVGSEKFLYTPAQYAREYYNNYDNYLFWYYNIKMDSPMIAKLV